MDRSYKKKEKKEKKEKKIKQTAYVRKSNIAHLSQTTRVEWREGGASWGT